MRTDVQEGTTDMARQRKSADQRSKGPTTRTALHAEDRLSVITTLKIGIAVRNAAHHSNLTVSDVVNWCIERCLDDFVRHHPSPGRLAKLRPGRKMRLT